MRGRSSDSCIFAAPAIRAGFPEAAAYYLGKVLECASFAGEPFMGKESILGTVTADAVTVTAMHPGQRCTVASVASHAMYERANPFFEHVAGGVLDMSHCRYEQRDERTTRVTEFAFRRDPVYRIKLEGSGKVGERAVSIAGIRDPYTIRHIDTVIAWARSKVEERWGAPGARYQLYYHVDGRDGVMGPWEPTPVPAHELCLVVEAVAPQWEDDLRARHPQPLLRAAARGEGHGRHGGPHDGRGAAGQAGLRVDGESRAAARRPARALHREAGRGGPMTTRPLVELAKTIRSKNAGVDQITFDVIFRDRESYELVRKSGALTPETVARLYGIPRERLTAFVEFDPALAIKFTIRRERPSGSPGERDVFGAQQYAPLFDLPIPVGP